MKNIMRPTRRAILRAGAASAAVLTMPAYLRAQSQSVKIGILQPVTGALAQDGEFGRMGAEMAIKEINDSGGLKGLGVAKLEMVFGDARSNPEAGTQEVEKMQADGVAAIIGGFASPICLAATQAAARYDLPYIVDVGVSDPIVQRGLKNTFRFAPGFGMVTGFALAKLMQTELPKRGFEILETIAHPTPARDMSNVALRIRSLRPDLVIPSSYYGEFV